MSHWPAELGGSWTHSFEEDEAGIQVYRPTRTFPFPPSRRGRETMEFGPGDEVAMGGPGPDDRPTSARVTVTALGMNRLAVSGAAGRPGAVIEIVEVTPEVLKVRLG